MNKNLLQTLIGVVFCVLLAVGTVLIYRSSSDSAVSSVESIEIPPPSPSAAVRIEPGPAIQPPAPRPVRPLVNVRPRPLSIVRQANSVSLAPLPEKLAPTLLSLQVKSAAPEQVLEQITRQTGLEFQVETQYGTPNWQPVTLDLENRPLLEALMQFCSQAGVQMSSNPGYVSAISFSTRGKLRIRPNSPTSTLGVWSITGPFVFLITRINHSQSLSPAGMGQSGYVNLSMLASAEPKAKMFGAARLALDQVQDEKGNSLLVPNPNRGGIYESYAPQYGLQHLQLHYPPEAGEKIAMLRGTARCLIEKKSERIEVDNPFQAGPIEKTIAGMKLTISPHGERGSSFGLKLRVEQAQADAAFWALISRALYDLRPTVVGSDGAPMRENGWGIGSFAYASTPGQRTLTAGEYNYSYSRSSGGRGGNAVLPAKLVLEVPTEVVEVAVPFEFKDLPLP